MSSCRTRDLPKGEPIRSELTHEQDIALIHPGPSQETMDRIEANLKKLRN